ncbi:glutamate receptor ionotropic, kainate 2-like isoform X2 [Anopheles aquasalis]|uniref:glutamate receptor ionotropic, kainate 2-like isoform X2 n=1 Tax=Anopheles aquasalis TaxID=42839 RepID=UPI00215A8EE4|nr:glutamate receptor ionotropic, kainate 2-like isoform X2 [Anopheles aquasalis]
MQPREQPWHRGAASGLLLLLLLLLLAVAVVPSDAKRDIPIGAIFHGDNYEAEIAFRYAVERVNMHEKHFELVPLVKYVSAEDSFKTERKVCELAAEGVTAIFGPSSILTAGIVGSVCKTLEIPHIVTHWDPEPLGGTDPALQAMSINLYPEADVLSRALADLIVDYSWKSFTIIYDTDEGLMRLKDILQIHGPNDAPITVRQIDDDPDYRPLLKDIQSSGESHIILEIRPERIVELLRQAKEVKMLEEYQSYIITSLDAHTMDFEELRYSRSNITALRLMDTKSFDIKNAVHDWEQGEARMKRLFRVSPEHVQTESALYNDAVKIYATAIRELDATEEITPSRLSCGSKNLRQWPFGLRIVNYMKVKTEHGITGPIIFDDYGRRTHFHLDIIELSKEEGFKKIATWDPTHGVNYTRSQGEVYSQIVESLQNKTFIVASRIGAPFLMHKEKKEGEFLEGNNRFEGYSLELIDGISKILGFQYRMELVPDGKYGSYNKVTKKWDGLVKHLLDRKADLAVCDLTITYERRTAVDFTMPFMTLGISILYATPVQQPKDLFSFLSPLSLDVWIYMATAYLGVSVLLFVLSRMAPADWENPHPCKQDNDEVENIWDMLNALWLTMGSIMGQGCDILPKAVSTRLVAGMWWFFALIMLSSYTANLAAFLTMERMDATIESAEDLAKQSKIKYGAVVGGSTMSFFQTSNFSTYQRMWAAMESARPSVFTKSNDEGRDRVIKGKRLYAFLMESTSLEYMTERYCELTQIGGLLDSKGYGIAMPVNSPYRTAISGAVLKMQEEGKLHQLKTRWWKEMHGGGRCDGKASAASSDSAAELGIGNVGGVFVVLAIGCSCAFIIGILEFLWNVRKVAVEERITPWDALKAELKFALNISVTSKPVHNTLSESTASGKSSLRSKSESRRESEVAGRANNVRTGASLMNLDKLGLGFGSKN